MKKFIFCSHGKLCEGMLDTLNVFSLYDENRMQAIPFYSDQTDTEMQLNQLEASIKEEDQVIIFTDIAFGSVNQQVMTRLNSWDNVMIVTGMNLLLVLELVATNQDFNEALIEEKIQSAKESIMFCKHITSNISDEDE